MNRASFDWWGLDLPSEDFACALTGIGVIQASGAKVSVKSSTAELTRAIKKSLLRKEKLVVWQSFAVTGSKELGAALPIAGKVATAWKQSVAQTGAIRLEVQDSQDWFTPGTGRRDVDPSWFVEQLQQIPVRAGSVFVRADVPVEKVCWNWPLQVGFMDDAESQHLRRRLEPLLGEWVGKLVEFHTLGAGHQQCDLLLLPFDVKESVRLLLNPRYQVQAGCLAVLDRTEPWDKAAALVQVMRAQVPVTGTALLRIDAERQASWLKELIRALSHDQAVDSALQEASQSVHVQAEPPLLFADRRLIDKSRLTVQAKEIVDRLGGEQLIQLAPEVARQFNIRAGRVPMAEIRNAVRARVADFSWLRESEGGIPIANLAREIAKVAAPTTPPEFPARWIQAQVYDCTNMASPVLCQTALRARTPHKIDVRIGPTDKDWLSPDEPFPQDQLPPGERHRLTVVFSEPRLAAEPQVNEVELPASGASSVCSFYLQADGSPKPIEARIIVLFGNRVLQTALLRADIASHPATSGKQIRLILEAVPRPGLGDLLNRQHFDAALVVNESPDGISRLTVVRDKQAKLLSLHGMENSVRNISAKLSGIDKTRSKLNDKETGVLLWYLAIQGVDLYRGLVEDNKLQHLLAGERPLQIVSARVEAFLPLEFLYDRAPPRPGAPLCSEARKALKEGRCPDSCPKGEKQEEVVCPLGFWCLSRVIERHMHDPALAEELDAHDFRLQVEPIAGRRELPVLNSAVVGASKKVRELKARPINKVMQTLDKLTDKQVSLVSCWETWIEEVKKRRPSLLVLLPHTQEDEATGKPAMEIGDSENTSYLLSVYVKKEHVKSGEPPTWPVVLLLGCETGISEAPFEHFVAAFRRLGAALVLSTVATILGRHAAPIAAALSRALNKSSRRRTPVSFGDVLLGVRRQLLAEGMPIVLSLTAYGDADWLLAPVTKEDADVDD